VPISPDSVAPLALTLALRDLSLDDPRDIEIDDDVAPPSSD